MEEKKPTAADIREKFKKPVAAPTTEKKAEEDSHVDSIRQRAAAQEELYTGEGKERAALHKTENDKHDKAKVQYRQTTLRVLLKDMTRFKNLESRFMTENSNLTYEKIFLVGLETIEKMNDGELKNFIERTKKE